MIQRPLILLSNDDGIHAPGLRALWESIRQIAEVEVVAPIDERSAVSHGINLHKPMPYQKIEKDGDFRGHALDATPADCVKLGITHLLQRDPDLVISGINPGANLGNNILYSGTCAAAREAAMLGVPAIALSVQGGGAKSIDDYDFTAAAEYAAEIAPVIIECGLPAGTILNINVPNLPPDKIRGVVVTRQGRTMYVDRMEASHMDGRVETFANMGDMMLRSNPEETDADDVVLEHNMISVSPLHFDLTHHAFRRDIAAALDAPLEATEDA